MTEPELTQSSLNATQNPLPRPTWPETAQIVADIFAPVLAKGPIRRRPKVMAVAERLGIERRGVKRMQALVDKYGPGPLQLKLFGREFSLILDPQDVHRVLDLTPEPFTPAELLKRKALEHFEPRSSLITRGPQRAGRREFNEKALGSDHPIHKMASTLLPAVREEAKILLDEVGTESGTLRWDDFNRAWFRMVRRVVLGDSARNDDRLIELIESLRSRGNLAFLRPLDRVTRDDFHDTLKETLDRAEPGSLAAFMQNMGPSETEPADQVPQWLFAFDPAGTAAWAAMALLSSDEPKMDEAREEALVQASDPAPLLPKLRHAVLDTLRLWPTTPFILRQATRSVEFTPGIMPEGSSALIFAPYFHRDDRHLEYANTFSPHIWDAERTNTDWPLVPFSDGSGICPGRHLVLMLTSNFIAELVRAHEVRLLQPSLDPRNVASTFNTYGAEFRVTSR